MYSGPNGHTGDANTTSLIIRHDRTDERGHRASALAQRTAAARASRDHHVHSPCPCAIEACCSLYFVAKLAIHCSHRTSAKAHARAHVSITMTCSGAWLEPGMRGSDTNGEQREQRERRRARWSPLPHMCGKARHSLVAEGPSKSERVKRLRSRLGVCTSQLVPAVHTLLWSCVACEGEALAGPSRSVCSIFRKSKDPQWAKTKVYLPVQRVVIDQG